MTDEQDRDVKPTPRRPRRRRRFLLGALGALVLVLLVVGLVAFYYVRTGRLDRAIQGEVQLALAEHGARTEFGTFEVGLSARTATATDVKVYDQATGKLIASADKAVITVDTPNLFSASLRRQVVFKR